MKLRNGILIALAAMPSVALSQGCVVSRGSGMSLLDRMLCDDCHEAEPRWQLASGYRYLHSDRHFVGSVEQKHRGEEGSQVINDSHFLDVAITYSFNQRTSLALTVPYATHDRSSVVRDSSRTILHRYHTQNSGLGDLRLTSNTWLFDPAAHRTGNILIGVGIDLPTGEEGATDLFDAYDAASGRVVQRRRTVDQSIQLGDGGWAGLLDVYAFRPVGADFVASFSGSYAITPEETNGVATNRSNLFEQIMGIADAYSARLGLEYRGLPNMSLSLAGRVEGVPVHDLVGGDDGFRRPGYTVSVEPGVRAAFGSYALALNAPIAIYRNRERSVADRRLSAVTGRYEHGDAAFADYLVQFSASKSF